MLEIFKSIIPAFAGMGIIKLFSWRIAAKSDKVDYADKAMKFMEDLNDKYTARINDMETRIEALEKLSCKKVECESRVA